MGLLLLSKNIVKRIPKHELVLVGLNHCHLEVIKKYAKTEEKPYRLTLIYPQNEYTFKENLPAAIIDKKWSAKCFIDVGHLCHSCGVTLIHDSVFSINSKKNELKLKNFKRTIIFDAISIETQSDSLFIKKNLAHFSKTILEFSKPQDFLLKWWEIESFLEISKNSEQASEPLKIGIIAASTTTSVELASSILMKTKMMSLENRVEIFLICESDLENLLKKNNLLKKLDQQEIKIVVTNLEEIASTSSEPDSLMIGDAQYRFDAIITAGAKRLPAWIANSDLVSSSGEIEISKTFELKKHRSYYFIPNEAIDEFSYHIFPRLRRSRRKAFTLANNIRCDFVGKKPTKYKRSRMRCSIIDLGTDGSFVKLFGFKFTTGWMKSLKKRVDTRWIERYRVKPKNIQVNSFVETGVHSEPICFGGSSMLPKEINDILPVGTNSHNISLIKFKETGDEIIFQAFDDLTSAQIDLTFFGQVAVTNVVNKIIATKSIPNSIQYSITVPFGPKKKHALRLQKNLRGNRVPGQKMELKNYRSSGEMWI